MRSSLNWQGSNSARFTHLLESTQKDSFLCFVFLRWKHPPEHLESHRLCRLNVRFEQNQWCYFLSFSSSYDDRTVKISPPTQPSPSLPPTICRKQWDKLKDGPNFSFLPVWLRKISPYLTQQDLKRGRWKSRLGESKPSYFSSDIFMLMSSSHLLFSYYIGFLNVDFYIQYSHFITVSKYYSL